jgi:hypothetical protein
MATKKSKSRSGKSRSGSKRTATKGKALRDYRPKEKLVHEYSVQRERDLIWTQNRYGALILNALFIAFLDVDLMSPVRKKDGFSVINECFAQAGNTPAIRRLRREALLRHFQETADLHPKLGFIAYATANGFRLLLTNQEYDPRSRKVHELAVALGVDPLYIKLCKLQGCFRARLTPKPGRIGIATEFRDSNDQEAWTRDYLIRAADYAVCEYVRSFGNPCICETVRAVLQIHDSFTIRPGAMLA